MTVHILRNDLELQIQHKIVEDSSNGLWNFGQKKRKHLAICIPHTSTWVKAHKSTKLQELDSACYKSRDSDYGNGPDMSNKEMPLKLQKLRCSFSSRATFILSSRRINRGSGLKLLARTIFEMPQQPNFSSSFTSRLYFRICSITRKRQLSVVFPRNLEKITT